MTTFQPYNPHDNGERFNHDAPCRLPDILEQATLDQLQEIERKAEDARKALHEQ